MRPLAVALVILLAPHVAASDPGALATCPSPSSPGILASGVPVLGTDTATLDCHYRISVAGPLDHMRLRVNASFSGDHDLYVKRGATANVGPYFCQGNGFSLAYEECAAALDLTGEYNVRVKRWSGSSDFLLTVFVEEIPPTCDLGHGTHALTGTIVANLTNEEDAHCMLEYAPAPGADFVRFTMTPATSDFDMYTRLAAPPTLDAWDCRPYFVDTATETCDHLVESDEPWYVMVHRFAGSGAFTLAPETIIIDTIELGEIVEDVVTAGATRYYKVVVPARGPAGIATTSVVIALEGTEGDADLYVRHADGLPTTETHDCASLDAGTTGACLFHDGAHGALTDAGLPPALATAEFQGEGRYFVAVRGVEGKAPFRLTAAWS